MPPSNAHRAIADYIEERSDALVVSWVEWLRSSVRTETISALPERALRNHVPPVLRSLAAFVRDPVNFARAELQGHLRLHAQVRRDQGYSLQEVLAEFDGLADLVTRGAAEAIEERAAEASARDAVGAIRSLADGLRWVAFLTVDTYDRFDAQRDRSFSSGLEEFARAVVHEMRNPLNTLSLAIEVVRRGGLDADAVEAHAQVMGAAVARVTSLVDTIHMLAIAESSRAGHKMVSITEAVGGVCKEFEEEAKFAGVEILVDDELPDVRVESMLAYVVLANLLANAIKYSDPGKSDRRVRIFAVIHPEESDSGFCEVAIEDNGIGIAAEFQPRLFQKGFRAHPDHAQGTGLGLYILQQAVEARGGAASVESREGRGSTFRVRLRCLDADAEAVSTERYSLGSALSAELLCREDPELPDAAEAADDPPTGN